MLTLFREKFRELPKWAKWLTISGLVLSVLFHLYAAFTLVTEGVEDNWMAAAGDLVIYVDGSRALLEGEDIYWRDIEVWPTENPNYYDPLFYLLILPVYALYQISPLLAAFVWWGLMLAAFVLSVYVWLIVGERLNLPNKAVFIAAFILLSVWNHDALANSTYGNVVMVLPLMVGLVVLGVIDHKPWLIALGCFVIFVTKPMWGTAIAFVLLFALFKNPALILRAAAYSAVVLIAGYALAIAVTGSPEYVAEQVEDHVVFLGQIEENYPFVSPDNPNEDGSVDTTNSSLKQSFLQYDLPDYSKPIALACIALFLIFVLWVYFQDAANLQGDLRIQLLLGGMLYFLTFQSLAVWMDSIYAPLLFALLWSYHYPNARRWPVLLVVFLLIGWLFILPLIYLFPHQLLLGFIFLGFAGYTVYKEQSTSVINSAPYKMQHIAH